MHVCLVQVMLLSYAIRKGPSIPQKLRERKTTIAYGVFENPRTKGCLRSAENCAGGEKLVHSSRVWTVSIRRYEDYVA